MKSFETKLCISMHNYGVHTNTLVIHCGKPGKVHYCALHVIHIVKTICVSCLQWEVKRAKMWPVLFIQCYWPMNYQYFSYSVIGLYQSWTWNMFSWALCWQCIGTSVTSPCGFNLLLFYVTLATTGCQWERWSRRRADWHKHYHLTNIFNYCTIT